MILKNQFELLKLIWIIKINLNYQNQFELLKINLKQWWNDYGHLCQMKWSSIVSHENSNEIKSKFEHTSWTKHHAMDDTMMNLETIYSGPVNPNDAKTCNPSKPNDLYLEKTHYAYETYHVLI